MNVHGASGSVNIVSDAVSTLSKFALVASYSCETHGPTLWGYSSICVSFHAMALGNIVRLAAGLSPWEVQAWTDRVGIPFDLRGRSCNDPWQHSSPGGRVEPLEGPSVHVSMLLVFLRSMFAPPQL